jgi:hypothetical protein
LLGAAETSGARISFFSSLSSGFSEGEALCVREASRELYTNRVAKERGPLAKGENPLLIGTEKQVLPPLGFGLLLNLPKPYRELRPTFRILSATRKNSLSLEI